MNPKNQLQELCQKRGCPIPEYRLVSRTGPSHRPVTMISVMVTWDGENMEEVYEGEGMKIKDVEKKAAEKMYERISSKLQQRPVPVNRTPPPTSLGVSASPVPASFSNPTRSPAPAANVKNQLQELLQKSIYNLPPPLYEQVPSERKGEFTAKVTIRNHGNNPLIVDFGYGKNKKDAEIDAARKVLPKVADMIEKRKLPNPIATGRNPLPPLPQEEVRDPELDSNIDHWLAKFSPCFDTREGTDKMILCLARASCGVAAHGMAENELAAERQAKINLLDNLRELGYTYT